MTITRLLIANRGEIATRIIRTARAMDIATVAVFSDPDADLPYVSQADEAVHLPGSTPAETYLDADAVLAAAERSGADAIHPGYGFLAENAGFARACGEAGLIFVGPSPAAIEAMGSKTAAKELMAAAGVPVLPGAVFAGTDEPTDAELIAAAEKVGFPVLVKAAFGGGGRGMRIVGAAAEVVTEVAAARREAAAAFGNGTVFLERFVDEPRHIEVQIFGDSAGTVVHLFERECSIQRRYQKIIEEAPSPAVDKDLRAQLCEAAVAAGRAIGYVGAGTVEFVLDSAGAFWFLEVNTRLQVEHPVTELVTGLDLVELQLGVAAGEPLPPAVTGATLHGHAIEARLYAEDVPGGYLPTSGRIDTFEVPAGDGLRVDAGYASGTEVSTFYDSMLAKVIAFGSTRDAARRTLAGALDRARLHGVVTNRDLLVAVLREPDFAAGAIDTGYLTRHTPAELLAGPDATPLHALAAALATQADHRSRAAVLSTLPSGWRNNPSGYQRRSWTAGDRELEVAYRIDLSGLSASIDGVAWPSLRLWSATPSEVDIEVDRIRRRLAVVRRGAVVYVDGPLGHSSLVEVERFPDPAAATAPGTLLAPMPGTVVRVEVAVGDVVAAGAGILAIEAMKMEHTIAAPGPGRVVELHVGPGEQVDSGMVLAVLEELEELGDD